MLYTPRFFSSKWSLFHNANLFGSCIIQILYTGCAKIKKNNSGAKRLRPRRRDVYLHSLFNLGDTWGWVVNSTPRPLYPPGKRHGTHCYRRLCGGPRAGLGGRGKSRPSEIRSPNCPARSESLNRLRYPGPKGYLIIHQLKIIQQIQ